MTVHGGQGKGIKRVHGQYRFCGRCGQAYDGVTPHGPGWCTPHPDSKSGKAAESIRSRLDETPANQQVKAPSGLEPLFPSAEPKADR